MSRVTQERNQHRTTPQKYLASMAVLMVASAWLAVADHQTRAEDESSVLPTALGETRWHPSGPGELEPGQLARPLAYYEGKGLFPRTRGVRKILAERLTRIGTTDNDRWGVYRLDQEKPGNEPDQGEYYLMVGQAEDEPARGLFRAVGGQKYRDGEAGDAAP